MKRYSKKESKVALDLGTSKVCCVVAQQEDAEKGSLKILGFGQAPSLGLKKGLIVDLKQAAESIAQAVDAAELSSGLEITKVITALSGSHLQASSLNGTVALPQRAIHAQDIYHSIQAAQGIALSRDREILNVLPQSFCLDTHQKVKNPIGMMSSELSCNIHLVTANAHLAQNWIHCLNNAGLQVSELWFQALASAQSSLCEDEKKLQTLLIDLGGGTTDFILYHEDQIIASGSIPIGGDHITSDLALILRISLAEAEKIKHSFHLQSEWILRPLGEENAQTISQVMIQEIIALRVQELFNLILKECKKIPYGFGVLTGGLSQLFGIEKIAQAVLQMPIRKSTPQIPLQEFQDLLHPKYSTVLGLLLLGFQRRPYQEKKVSSQMAVVGSWFKELF